MTANSLTASALKEFFLEQLSDAEKYAIEAAKFYFKSLMENDNESTFCIPEGNHIVDNLMELLNKLRNFFCCSPVNKLFFTYLDMNDVLTYSYISEKLGDWYCYLKSLKMMLPYLAATGH